MQSPCLHRIGVTERNLKTTASNPQALQMERLGPESQRVCPREQSRAGGRLHITSTSPVCFLMCTLHSFIHSVCRGHAISRDTYGKVSGFPAHFYVTSSKKYCFSPLVKDSSFILCILIAFYLSPSPFTYFYFTEYRGRGEWREKEKQRNIDLFFHLFMNSLVDSCMCPDLGLNLQPWHIQTML